MNGVRLAFVVVIVGVLTGCPDTRRAPAPVPSATPSPSATPTPVARLEGAAWERRLEALKSLAETEAGPDYLLASLGDEAPEVRRTAARMLSPKRSKTAKVRVRLTALVRRDTDGGVRTAAREALLRLWPARGPKRVAGRSLLGWITALGDDQALERRAAARALGRFGRGAAPAMAALMSVLGDRDPTVRYLATRCLGRLGSLAEPACARLQETLSDADARVRRGAAMALGEIGRDSPAISQALAQLLIDPAAEVRAAAAQALGALGPGALPAVDALLGGLSDASGQVRSAAAEALGRVGPAAIRAAGVLVARLGDPEARVGQEAERALVRFGPAAVTQLMDGLRSADRLEGLAATRVLASFGPQALGALPTLVVALRDPRGEIRRRSAIVLGAIGPSARSAAGPLAECARKDGEPAVREAAQRALQSIGPR